MEGWGINLLWRDIVFSRQVSFVSKNPLHLGMGSMSIVNFIGLAVAFALTMVCFKPEE